MLGPQDIKGQEKKGISIEMAESPPAENFRLEPTGKQDMEDLTLLAVGRAMGMDSLDKIKQHGDRLKSLVEWAQLKGAKDQVGYVVELKQIMNRLGSPTIYDLVVYTRLDKDRIEAEKRMQKMEKL